MPVLPALAILAAIVVALTGPAAAQERRVPTGAEIKLSFAPIVQRVAPAVVNVYAAKVVENRNPLFERRAGLGQPGAKDVDEAIPRRVSPVTLDLELTETGKQE